MLTMQELSQGRTLAEEQGMTEEMGSAIARLASEELGAGRLDTARALLEGLAVTNPMDPAAWAMLAQVERRHGRSWTAWHCAETAARLAPADEQVRLVRAEALLAVPEQGAAARAELSGLAGLQGSVGERARSLLAALGSP